MAGAAEKRDVSVLSRVSPRRWTHAWGATAAEHAALLPGDELVADPAIVATRAVTVDAPVDEVWSWLVQIGQDRGGMYSYDRLENLLGLHIHSTETIRPEWQHLEVGDRIVLVPAGWGGMKAGYELPVALVDAPRTLVLRQAPPEHPWDAVWSFHVRPLADGRTRLLSRSRSHRHAGARGALDLALDTIMDPITWVMTRKMLRGIRERAERRGADPSTDPSTETPAETPARRAGSSLRRRLDADVARLPRHCPSADRAPVLDADLDPLPEPAQRWLRWMGVPGQPRVTAFRARFRGEIRMRPEQRWMPYDAWQCNRADPVARLVRMRITAAGVVPMLGTDRYLDGRGRMRGKLLGVVPVADGQGAEFDLSELVTYVNDAVMLAPSMLLSAATEWRPVDDATFELTFSDAGNRVTARCVVDEDGRLVTFRTDDRWYAGTKPPSRARWSTPVDGWDTRSDGHRLPTRASAVWHLPDGEFGYVRGAFDPASVRFASTATAAEVGASRDTRSPPMRRVEPASRPAPEVGASRETPSP